MSNLFFVHTPFQLFVAQQIIRQENLVKNVMIKGYVGNNRHFYDIYDVLKINEYWVKEYPFEDLPSWATLNKRHLFSSCRRVSCNVVKMESIIDENKITNVYLGDINNYSCKLAALFFSKKGIKVNFFEEGTSHYSYHSEEQSGLKCVNVILAFLVDSFFYIPKLGFKFGKWRFVQDMPFSKIPINRRYSIINKYHEIYDKSLKIEKLFSSRLELILSNDCFPLIGKDSILFLTQPIYDLVLDPRGYQYYLDVIENFIQKNKNKIIALKMHPRETLNTREDIICIAQKYNVEIIVLSQDINIPVEYYLQFTVFSEIVTFFSSTVMYNGLLYPLTHINYLLDSYHKKCRKNGLRVNKLFESIVDLYSYNRD